MIQHPFESGELPEEVEAEAEARPMPCPKCESTRGYIRVISNRVQCVNCKSILKSEEVDMSYSDQEQK